MTRFLLALVLALCASRSVIAADRPPNVLVILCDDLGYGDLGCYGHPTIKTPHLDALATQGIRFTDCYSAAPVCSSSRVGLLTGRTPDRAGVYDWIPGGSVVHMRRGEVTTPMLLRGAGYDTALVGKWHCNGKFNSDAQPQPGDFGFDHWFATQNNAAPSHRDPKNFVRNGQPVGKTEGFSSHVVAGEAIAWLKGRGDKSKPFYLQVCFHEPHEPIDSPDELVAKYEAGGAKKKGEALYYANVENMDAAAGKLLAALDELGVADDTLVFFTSDNGPETLNRYGGAWRSHGSPGELRGMKLWMYDGGIRVAGILRWPAKVKAGVEFAEPIASLDLLPTLCGLAGVKPPADRHLDGADITPLITGAAAHVKRDQPLFWHYVNALGAPKLAMREGDWMLVATVKTGGAARPGAGFGPGQISMIKDAVPDRYELYNLRTDRAESRDLATDEPDRLAAMSKQMSSIWRSVQADAPDWRDAK